MLIDYDLGEIFSKGTMSVAKARWTLEQYGIKISDSTGSVRFHNDNIDAITCAVRGFRTLHDNRSIAEAMDTILKQEAVITDSTEASNALDEFLSAFRINDTRLEVS